MSNKIDKKDLQIDIFTSGCNSTVRVTHIPTGLVESCSEHRSQLKNKRQAVEQLEVRIKELK